MDRNRHYVPAASIGRFSECPVTPLRESRIWVGNKSVARRYKTKAERVGVSTGIYGYGKSDGLDFDNLFKPFEARNDDSLNPMLYETGEWRDATPWFRCAQYIASQIARNPDGEGSLPSGPRWEQIGIGYPLDLQRIAGAVLRTRWLILHSSGEFILNDRGFCGCLMPGWRGPALLLPLRRDVAVVLGGGARCVKPAKWDQESWRVRVPARRVHPQIVHIFNGWTWRAARKECYASSEHLLVMAEESASRIAADFFAFAKGNGFVYDALGSSLEERMADEQLVYQTWNGLSEPNVSEDPPVVGI